MKILLIFTFYLISGPVTSSDVIAYSGGSVIIFSKINWYAHDGKYICKLKENDCSDIIRVDTKRRQVQDGRFMLYSNPGKHFLVLIRKIKPQDAGMYRFGLEDQDSATVNLIVHNNASCAVPKIMGAYLGQNMTITCKYPGEYKGNNKYFDSLDDDSNIKDIVDTDTNSQNGRFSISDDRSNNVIIVHINNVTENDEVYYLLGIWNGDGAVRYYTYFREMQLHITGSGPMIQPTAAGCNMMTSSPSPSPSSSPQTEVSSTMSFRSSSTIQPTTAQFSMMTSSPSPSPTSSSPSLSSSSSSPSLASPSTSSPSLPSLASPSTSTSSPSSSSPSSPSSPSLSSSPSSSPSSPSSSSPSSPSTPSSSSPSTSSPSTSSSSTSSSTSTSSPSSSSSPSTSSPSTSSSSTSTSSPSSSSSSSPSSSSPSTSTSTTSTSTSSTSTSSSSSQTEVNFTKCLSSSAFISVCLCAALLWIGGFALMIYKLRPKKMQENAVSSKSGDNKPAPSSHHTDSDPLYHSFNTTSL